MSAATAPLPRRFSFSHLALVVPWIALVIASWDPITDNSFLWHIRAGSIQMENIEVLTSDPFSFTMFGADWRTQSWLAELAYAAGERFFGLGFVPWFVLGAGFVTLLAIGLIAYRRSRSVPATASILLLSVLVMVPFLAPRPVVFSFALFALVGLAWERPHQRWGLPFLFWVWASVHGSFVLGLAYIGLSVIRDKERTAFRVAVASGAATLLTAHGLGVIEMLLDFAAASDVLRTYFPEWRRPGFGDTLFIPFLGGVALMLIGAYRRLLKPADLWLIVPFMLLGLGSIRAIAPAWIAMAPLIATSMSGFTLASSAKFGYMSAAVFAVVVSLVPVPLVEYPKISESAFPVAAAEHLRDVPTFHDDFTGGYLIWAQGPERLVYIDDRGELFKDRIPEFLEVRSGASNWREVFSRDGIEQALLETDERLVGELIADGWVESYRDEAFVILRSPA